MSDTVSGVLLREAQIRDGDKKSEWMIMGNVTMVEAARRMAMWHFYMSEKKRLPKTLKIYVRDSEGGSEFPMSVSLQVSAKVIAFRGDEE